MVIQNEVVDADVKTGNEARVFVYGTLKAGHGNNRALRGSKFLGKAHIDGCFTLVDLGWYPGVLRTGQRRHIYGEVYLVSEDVLHTLDLIEGHPNFYERIKVATPYKNAWVYTLPGDYLTAGEADDGKVIDSGMWKPSEEDLNYVRSLSQQAV